MPEEKTVRLRITLPEAELRAIEDWSREHQVGDRDEAIRRLIRLGLGVGLDSEREVVQGPRNSA